MVCWTFKCKYVIVSENVVSTTLFVVDTLKSDTFQIMDSMSYKNLQVNVVFYSNPPLMRPLPPKLPQFWGEVGNGV
jgi:hypothetical protein